jgi:hypothetical protein
MSAEQIHRLHRDSFGWAGIGYHYVIRKDGTITDVKAIRSPHLSLSKEAIRIVSEMPQWIPAKINGKDVSMRMTLPVVFKMR